MAELSLPAYALALFHNLTLKICPDLLQQIAALMRRPFGPLAEKVHIRFAQISSVPVSPE